MPEPARPVDLVSNFPGLLTNADPRDLPAGAAEEQVNLTCVVEGELRVRQGIRPVVFEE